MFAIGLAELLIGGVRPVVALLDGVDVDRYATDSRGAAYIVGGAAGRA